MAAGRVLDAALPERFGFREFWIDGRDFYLNGSRIFLCAVPLDNAQIGAAWATYEGAKESLERLKSFGINFVYTHNYGCEPGTHLGFAEILRAADDEGMLVSFSQPHFGQYQWRSPDADQTNGYARHAEFYVRAAENHPSVVFYSMSHNATGTEEEMNPDMIDGLQDVRNQWSGNNVKQALRAEAIVKRLDPSRIVYHHSSGNLSSMHTANFYANFAPIQEMSDWFEHWATEGVKPVFLCEYGVPISWDWMMYRGWYKGVRTFGSAQVPWELCLAEWDAQFLGDQAYQLTDLEKECLRWEAKQLSGGPALAPLGLPAQCRRIARLRAAQRGHGHVPDGQPARLPHLGHLGVLPVGPRHLLEAARGRGARAQGTQGRLGQAAAARLQPGLRRRSDGMDQHLLSSVRTGSPPPPAQALIRNNMPLLAYLGGKPAAFTSKDHNFYPGDDHREAAHRHQQLAADGRRAIAVGRWRCLQPVSGRKEVSVETGQQARLPLQLRPARRRPSPADTN